MVPRRKFIIDRAAEVVFRQGFGATTVSDVLAAACVGKGNFYHYFTGKEELGLSIIDRLGAEIGGAALDDVFAAHKPPLRRLADFLDIVRRTRLADRCVDPLCTLSSELGGVKPYSEHLRGALYGLLGRIESLIGEAAQERNVAVDSRRLARMALALVHGTCVQFRVDGDDGALDAGLDVVWSTICTAIHAAVRERTDPAATLNALAG